MKERSESDWLKLFNNWVYEAHMAQRDWREESWRDFQFYDGQQWTEEQIRDLEEQEIDPLTINRIFPVCNLVIGSQAINRMDMQAKARSNKDAEISQVMSEGMQFVMDQNQGGFKVSSAFKDSIIGGFGCLYVGTNPDPRREEIEVSLRDWKDVYWDPFSDPWFEPHSCRYVFHQPWIDLETLIGLFPDKERDIRSQFRECGDSGEGYQDTNSALYDESTEVEDEQRLASSSWVVSRRKRVRPVEIWYTRMSKGLFAKFRDGTVVEINEREPALAQFDIIRQAEWVAPAVVHRMWTATFFADTLLQHVPTPFGHDQYPFVPFVCYLDKSRRKPYGVPRQIRDMQMEVNKRRSMALALLNAKRTIVEEGASDDMQAIFDEVRKVDGMVVVGEGKAGAISIESQAPLVKPQIDLLQLSEGEIQEITGANHERMGYSKAKVQSGVAIERRMEQSATLTAEIFDNERRSLDRLGTLVVSQIQKEWQGEKVLRITDRLTGAERYIEVNRRYRGPDGSVLVMNNVVQGKYDIVISQAPAMDTVRERYLELIIEWVKKSPPETVPQLLITAMEMANIPDKEKILAKLKPLMGNDPREEDMSPEELKQAAIQKLEAQSQQAQQAAQVEQQMISLQMQEQALKNEKIKAEIEKILATVDQGDAKASQGDQKVQIEAFKAGTQVEKQRQDIERDKMKMAQAEADKNREKEKAELAMLVGQQGEAKQPESPLPGSWRSQP